VTERHPRRRPWLVLKLAVVATALAAVVVWADSTPLMQAVRGQLWGLNSLHYTEFERRLPARQNAQLHVGVGPGQLQPEQSAPSLLPKGGIFSDAVSIVPGSADKLATVRCTFDGSIPTQRSDEITAPRQISRTTVVRCRSFRAGYQASATTTRTYVIKPTGALPIVALTLDPTNLANKYTGIYARFNERGSEWEREVQVEYLSREPAAEPVEVAGRLRIHGFYSRTNPKKSLRLYFPTLPAEAHDDDNMLTWRSPHKERAVILGAGESNVNRDELFQGLYAAAGGYAPATQPVVVYLNAEYWGIYFLRERVNEEFLHRKVGPGAFDLLYLYAKPDVPRVMLGDIKRWNETIKFFQSSDFSRPETLARAAEFIDLDNFTDYWLFNIYASNRDWPHHNMYIFRRRDGGDGRWRWISWDADATWNFLGKGLTHDTLAWSTRAGPRHDLRWNAEAGLKDSEDLVNSTLIARKLLENDAFRRRFADRMRALTASAVSPDAVLRSLDGMHARLQADLESDRQRWKQPGQIDARMAYEQDLARVRDFARQRPAIVADLFDKTVAR